MLALYVHLCYDVLVWWVSRATASYSGAQRPTALPIATLAHFAIPCNLAGDVCYLGRERSVCTAFWHMSHVTLRGGVVVPPLARCSGIGHGRRPKGRAHGPRHRPRTGRFAQPQRARLPLRRLPAKGGGPIWMTGADAWQSAGLPRRRAW